MGETDEIHIKFDPEVDMEFGIRELTDDEREQFGTAQLDFPLRQVEGQPGSFYGHFTPKLTPREKPKAIYYGAAAHLGANELLRSLQDRARRADVSERPDYLEWAEPPWHGLKRDVAPGEEWTHYCTQARREITTRFSKCSCGRTRGDNLGGRIPRELRASSPWNGMSEVLPNPPWHNQIQLERDLEDDERRREPMADGDGKTYDRYPGGDTPQLWSRRGLSEHIRLELQVLGLLPGPDGNFQVPGEVGVSEGVSTTEKSGPFGDQFWEHECPARLRQEDRRITLLLNRQCAECGAWAHACGAPPGPSGRQIEGPLIDWDNVDHFKINIDGEWIAVSKYHVQAVRKD